ncbi:hypothetical protein GH741_07525 [Aquibacillus halophilus]|uniref:Uncharacterized protein n=1 Tax=Aquibacillus halophilus TaxID=930132 RepID=A0A6A8DMQ7_9BACI|nr:hypothetical protein [Aquibacillus halophilus]
MSRISSLYTLVLYLINTVLSYSNIAIWRAIMHHNGENSDATTIAFVVAFFAFTNLSL